MRLLGRLIGWLLLILPDGGVIVPSRSDQVTDDDETYTRVVRGYVLPPASYRTDRKELIR